MTKKNRQWLGWGGRGILLAGLLAAARLDAAQTNDVTEQVKSLQEGMSHLGDQLSRQVNELLWFQRLGEVARVDKVRFTGPPPRETNGLASPVGSNEVVISALTFLPKRKTAEKQTPLIVFVHGEIHGNTVGDDECHVVQELVERGYAVIAPDYRGSSGYGGDFWRQIDYGGLEIEDVHAARCFMLERYSELNPGRVGVIGWSHGGLIALMTVFVHPEDYQVCYAGVPVSDLEERMRIKGKGYEALFSAPYHLGKTVSEAPEEYRRRSPAWNAAKLRTPLLVHANTSDADVNLSEVNKLIEALKAADKVFSYRIYTNAPGGHDFNRLDTPLAQASRRDIYEFLAKYLN
jgi:dipeptidyl aminopeptidase/acylaminoacyl peptidase